MPLFGDLASCSSSRARSTGTRPASWPCPSPWARRPRPTSTRSTASRSSSWPGWPTCRWPTPPACPPRSPGAGVTVVPVTRSVWAQPAARGLPAAVRAAGRLAAPGRPTEPVGRRPAQRGRPDRLDGPAHADDRAHHAGHDGRVDGRAPGPPLVRATTTCPSPGRPTDELTIVTANLDEFGREWSLPARRPAPVGLPPRDRHPRRAGRAPRAGPHRALPARLPGRVRDRLGRPRAAPGRGRPGRPGRHGRPAVAVRRPRGPARRHPVPGPAPAAPQFEALVTVVVGYVDHVMDEHRPRPAVVLRAWSPRRCAAAGSRPTSPTASSSACSASS